MKEMPLMGLGTFIGIGADRIADEKKRTQVTITTIVQALAIGYRHFDLSASHDNFPAVAEALETAFAPQDNGGLGIRREDLWLTMRAKPPITPQAIDTLLKKVGVAYFDLLLIDNPTSGMFANENNLIETWSSVCNLVPEKARNIGLSNAYIPHLKRLVTVCEQQDFIKPYANEVELNLWSKNLDLVAFCKEHNIKLIAYSPLGYNMRNDVLNNHALAICASQFEASKIQTVLAWIMAKGVAVIPKSTNIDHLRENFSAL